MNEYLHALEQELRAITKTDDPRHGEFFNIFQYHLGWTDAQGNPHTSDTGKRLRPLLCLWSCEALGGNWREALPAAAAIELLHNFSLIHDDIEDNSAERRGRKTVWKIWGLAQGINAGDAMFVLAQDALDRLNGLPLERYLGIRRAFNANAFALTLGQYLDLGFERADQVTLDQYFEMVRGKSAALVAVACEIGARIATEEAHLIRAFAEYGENLGIAFQITDDVLGMWGDPEVTGKSARSDLLSRKKSYPLLAAMESEMGAELFRLYAKEDWSEDDLKRIQILLEGTNARGRAVQEAERYARRALFALDATNLQNAAMTRLRELLHQAVHREK